MLYPEKTREDLELCYHAMVAALNLAAREKVGPDSTAVCAQIEEWLRISEDGAVKSALVRQERNLAGFEGVKQ